jgi:hypothetical protein
MSPTITYPTGGEYREALFNTRLCFKDPALVGGAVTLDSLGMPKPISGASASVFTIKGLNGRLWAVKCFTRFVSDQEVRYRRISEALKTVNKPWRVEFEYLHDGVFCSGAWFPALKMEWIEAIGLMSFIETHLWEPGALADLAEKFAQMMEDLSALGIAHGDLQHGNLLVTKSGELKLIDYDGMYVPSLAQMGACERGHVNYQSPARTMRTWGPYLDNFSAWIIYVSLVALTVDPSLWSLLHRSGDEALLFNQQDFVDYRNSRVFHALNQNPQPTLSAIADAINLLWVPELRTIPRLDPGGIPAPNKASSSTPSSPPTVSATHASAAGRSIPDWVVQAQAGATAQGSSAPSNQGNASWVAGHLPPLPLVTFNPSRLVLRVLLAVEVILMVALGLCAAERTFPAMVAGIGSSLLVSIFVALSAILFRRTPERRNRAAKLASLKDHRAVSSRANREVARLEHVKRDIDSREAKATDKINKQADKAKASEQEELADRQKRLTAETQSIERQMSALQGNEAKETGNALRVIQQQHVESHMRLAAIKSARIPGIGPGVISSLASNGIVTAADFVGIVYMSGPRGGQQLYIRRRDGLAVHPSGVGEKKARDLENWRRNIESRAARSQPFSLPPAAAQAIRGKYLQQQQMLTSKLQATRIQAVDDQKVITQKWVQTHAAISGQLVVARQDFAQERANVSQLLTESQKQAHTAAWQHELAQREEASYRNVRYRRYIFGVIRPR